MDSNVLVISKVIYNKYEETKISKRDLALKTGLSLNTVNNALSGKNLTVNTLFKIMECLGLNLEDVVNEAKKMNLSFPKISTTSDKLNSDQVKKLIDSGKSISQVAKQLGVTESDVEQVIQKSLVTTVANTSTTSATKKIEAVEIK